VARKRIELPSADELFGDRPPAPKPATRKPSVKKAAPKKAAAKKATKPVTARKPATAKRTTTATPARNGHGATAESRLSALESRLTTLPVDALIDLRDGLEELLAAEVVDEAAVRGLLDSFDG